MELEIAGRRGLGRKLYETAARRVVTFWYGSAHGLSYNPAASVLKAVSRVYGKLLDSDQARKRRRSVRLPAPVISIGNIVAGGTGKTPLVIWLCRFLEEMGFQPAVLSRGYGGKGHGASLVPGTGRSSILSEHFGDEPVLMAGTLPSTAVRVGADRVVSGAAALAEGADVLVLDDGFQHLALQRDLDIVLLDCRNPFGNGLLLPCGPLREPVSHLMRADALVLTNVVQDGAVEAGARFTGLFPDKPVFSCSHRAVSVRLPGGLTVEPHLLAGRRVAAFAGIAHPGRFFMSLANGGMNVLSAIAFPDHHRYSGSDLARVIHSASCCGAEMIITTAKDAVRVPGRYHELFAVLEIEIDFGSDRDRFCRFIRSRLGYPERNRQGNRVSALSIRR